MHNNHNYAAFEEHFGRTYWVVRKGCTPAFPGQEGFVGGSMGDASVILVEADSQVMRTLDPDMAAMVVELLRMGLPATGSIGSRAGRMG